MLAVAKGDDHAYRLIFDRYYPRAVNIAYRTLGDAVVAEDVAMEAFLRVYQARLRYRPSAKFSTYLYRIVVNLCLNYAKRVRMLTTLSAEDCKLLASDHHDPAKCAERRELGGIVREAVLRLPPNQRLALALVRYENLSYESAAEVMGVSVKALESLLHRAKQNLRKSLKSYVQNEDG